ncbi:MAG: xylosidase/arabinosidase [Verrucomicrobia bacterium]|jgi:hypothetical protein|nr:xylosidase/arabinosidase [Verrucomicrobiota bacterium]MDB4745767.1 glycoside hydrolase family 71/99-like protein [Verrucomicrobiota bacterium]MDB4745785.1 glycoside hydrolase family 71/99-like protein [Verrucomicrobiota bacterium]
MTNHRLTFFLSLLFYSPLVEGQSLKVDPSSLSGKIMCGYQGWFNCEGDGAELGWTHWARNRKAIPGPDNVTVDLWPDLSEYGPEERFATNFRLVDGSPAEIFSSYNRQTVLRHFEWMRDYGIDGAFIQRFANGLRRGTMREHKDAVLNHGREGARKAGRVYAVMYDLSGLRSGGTRRVQDDWKRLRRELRVTEDKAYLKHEGKPLVAVWGIGFGDGRAYTLEECRELVSFLKDDGCAVMLGVPTGWREGVRDAVKDPGLQSLIESVDVVSPWTVGRYRNPNQATRHADTFWRSDLAWCEQRKIDFLPVVYPGFSWSNLKEGTALGAIPRLKGQFLWSQLIGAKRVGCNMIYVAMFDEVDEATAIFKCTNHPPTGDGAKFLTYEGLPSDFYLRLTGAGGRMLRGEIPATDALPITIE